MGSVARREVADDLSAVRAAAAWLDALIVDVDFSPAQRHDVHVCLEEALANLIMHGRAPEGAKGIAVEVKMSTDVVTIAITDRCKPFDITSYDADARHTAKDQIGGHGVLLLRTFATELSYESGADRNDLRMTFRSNRELESDLIRGIPALAQVSSGTLHQLMKSSQRKEFEPGSSLVAQGEQSAFALILLSGEVAVINESRHGEAPLARVSAPALIGEIGALAGLPRTASVRAATSVRALLVERGALIEAAREAPDILLSVIGQLGQQLVGINGALGLYAAGLAALERDDLDPSILDNLKNPTDELRNFAEAFRGLARRVTVERRTRSEMASAALIQASMLPPPLDKAVLAGRCDVFGSMKPAREVGGDLFDHFMLDEDRVALVIADVCGKGVPAALFMCVAATALRLAAQNSSDLSSVVARTNAILCANNTMSMFATVFYAILHLPSGRLDYVNCGHNPPMLMRGDGACAELPGGGLPLGLYDDRSWTAHATDLNPGDSVFLFSDGITECVNADGEDFGEARLMQSLSQGRGASAADLVAHVLNDAQRFSVGEDQFDDMTCVAALLPSLTGGAL